MRNEDETILRSGRATVGGAIVVHFLNRTSAPRTIPVSLAFAAALFAATPLFGLDKSLGLSPLPEDIEPPGIEAQTHDIGLTDISIFRQFSGVLNTEMGQKQFFSGKGTTTDGAAICFVATTTTNATFLFLPTIGTGNYDAVQCQDISEIGVGAAGHLVIIYQARSPNYAVIEPVAFDLSANGTLEIDAVASQKLSLAGVTSVEAAKLVLGE